MTPKVSRMTMGRAVGTALALALVLVAPAGRPAVSEQATPVEVALVVPSTSPEAFALDVRLGGRVRRLLLRRHSLRARGFEVRTWDAVSGESRFVPAAPSTYRGVLADDPRGRVFASLDRGRLTGYVEAADGDWSIRPGSDGRHRIEPGATAFAESFECAVSQQASPPGAQTPAGGLSGLGQQRAEIAFDVDFHYYQLKGSSVQASVDAVEAILNQVDFFYARDVMITYEITTVIVRTSQFYFPTGGGNLLDLFRAEWESNQTSVARDMAHLMTNKDNIEFGGLAWVGATCTSLAYGWSLDSANIVGHELGHNWGSSHCHDPAPCNNMCGGCLYVAPATRSIMVAYRDSVLACLDDVGAYADPLPPYAAPESVRWTRDELALGTPLAFDVLGNDHDGNLDPLSVDGHDAVSLRDGAVALSPGSGPEGRDELVYTPAGVFPGRDRFAYVVGDGTGEQQTGDVTVDVPGKGLAGYWKLDDASGSAAADSSNRRRHGTLEGGPSWSASAAHGGGLAFDGVDDRVTAPALNLYGNHVTISAWVYRIGTQQSFAQVVFSRDGNTTAGLGFGNANELRYHWNDAASSYGFDTDLIVPDQQWVFVALVVEPDRATIYLDDGTLRSAVNAVPHGIEEFDGALTLGHDPGSSQRRFEGLLDDVRVYDHALTPAEIQDLVLRGGKALAPNPPDAGYLVPELGELSWLPGLLAESHDVYLGDDYAGVRDATPTSPEFRGNGTEAGRVTGGLAGDRVWAFRVDEVVAGQRVPGRVWLFELVDHRGHWKLDEAAGGAAADARGNADGTYLGGVSTGQAGATQATGLSAEFDGSNDHVEIPPLNLDTERLTITGWARRDGPQSNFAGLVFSRGGNTVAGISTLTDGELRYHWNDGHWDWSPGLGLPDGQWAFFALVVEPDRATIYLGHHGSLQSATNDAIHGVEEFDGELDLGRDGPVGRYFDGGLDNIHVYRAALTPRDVDGLYRRELQGLPAGGVPASAGAGGAPLRVARSGAGDLALTWSPSCGSLDDDFAIYEGAIGDFASHVPATCTTSGATAADVTPSAGSRYYLVVPLSANQEGSHGVDGDGAPRLQGPSVCLPRFLAGCD